ncbi:hypothetical protein BMETH_910_1 [methanotrophic bacterial endosymbiont of Bathymodiolus sp.]|nr:hypothetical protein BMETH_910_1 [methanotrophic bacterial endosymbiont of Bathymodiolus sp.]
MLGLIIFWQLFVVDHRYFSLPVNPCAISSNKFSHKVSDIYSTGFTCIKNCTTNG